MLKACGFPPHLPGAVDAQSDAEQEQGAEHDEQGAAAAGRAPGHESRELQSVIEMCQMVVMGNEDTLAGFPVRQVVHAFNVFLKMEHNLELITNAGRARALT